MSSYSTFRHPFPSSDFIDSRRMVSLVERFWRTNRSAVSPDTDGLAAHLSQTLGGDLLEVKAGTDCFTWRVPKRWHVRKAQLRTLNGEVIADFSENPLLLWTHSCSFSGEIDRQSLLSHHIVSDPNRPGEVKYQYLNGYRDGHDDEWGFSLPHRVVQSLKEETYFVDIDASLDDEGTLKVADAYLPGQHAADIAVCAHTCHPGIVSDGIACVALACELFHLLRARRQRRYGYRFLFGPEYFGGAAWLAHAPAEHVKALSAVIYLDMLSTHEPLVLQASRSGDSFLDRAARHVLSTHQPNGTFATFREVFGNDEIFFDGPGIGIPAISLTRKMHREYHYDSDNIENMNVYHLVEAAWLLWRICEILETDVIPSPMFKGPVYRSRYPITEGVELTSSERAALDEAQWLMDGNRSAFDIAVQSGIDFFRFFQVLENMAKFGLAGLRPSAPALSTG